MSGQKKLDAGQKHLLRLVAEGQMCPDGWAPVSAPVYPILQRMPEELVELRQVENGRGIARLTSRGQALIDAMAWL